MPKAVALVLLLVLLLIMMMTRTSRFLATSGSLPSEILLIS